MSEEELESFYAILGKLEGIEEKKVVTKPNKVARDERDSILAKIKSRLEEAENSGVKIRTGIIVEGLKLLGDDLKGKKREDIFERWRKLDQAVENLNIAKAMMQFEQGRLIYHLSLLHHMTEIELAQKFNITRAKVSEYDKYYRFCKIYPALLFSSYTMGTLMKYKKELVKMAAIDERFLQLLQLQQETVELHLENGKMKAQTQCKWFDEDLEADLLEEFLNAGETIPSKEPQRTWETDQENIITLANRASLQD